MVNSAIHYFQNSWEELKKATWPSREETGKKTLLVIIISIGIAFYLGLLDYLLNLLLELII